MTSLLPKNNLYGLEVLTLVALLLVAFIARHELFSEVRSFFSSRFPRFKTARSLSEGVIHFTTIGKYYRDILETILVSRRNRRMAVVMVVLFSFFSYLLVPFGFVRNEFFPSSDQNYLYLSLELPAGTNLQTTKQEALNILNSIRTSIPDADFVTTSVGLGVGDTGGYSSSGNNTALFTVVLPDPEKRHLSSIDIAENLRKQFAAYPKGTVSVVEESGGPPAGADIQIKLFGDDLGTLDTYANKVQDFLKKQAGVTNVQKSITSGTSKLVFVPDKQAVANAGLTQDTLGYWLRLYASGVTIKTEKFASDPTTNTDITIRMSPTTESADSINTIMIPTAPTQGQTTGSVIPLSSLGHLELRSNPTLITRENGKRTISVTAAVTKGYSITGKNQDLEKFVNTSLHLPDGYTWSTGGVNEQNTKSVQSILQAMILSFMLIIITMVLQFGSFRKAFIVMLVIPLSISGVFIIFAITHTPLSFPALIGVLALFGIVVKNSILIVDKINQNERAGLPYREAIADAAESRLEPIALTSFCAIVGLLPVTLSNALWQGLGGAIIAGLFFSGTIMLFFIPIVYYMVFQNSEGERNIKTN